MPQIHEHSLVGHSYNERLPALIFGLSLLGPKSSPSPYHTQHLIPVVPFTRNDIITISLTDYTLNHSAISPSLKTTQQCPLLAPLVHGPKTVWECVCACVRVCVDGMNLKYALRWHIHISVHSVLCQCYTQAHAPSNRFRIANRRGLKVDIANYTTTHCFSCRQQQCKQHQPKMCQPAQ